MATNNFLKILNSAINEIEESLAKKYSNKYKEIEAVSPISQGILDLDKRIQELKTQIKLYELEKTKIDTYVTSEQRLEMESYDINNYNMKNSEYEIHKEILKTPLAKNKKAFQIIAKRFRNMMNLAVSSKEERAVLLKFYSLNWKDLGIDVPPDMNIEDINISNGEIIIDKLLLN